MKDESQGKPPTRKRRTGEIASSRDSSRSDQAIPPNEASLLYKLQREKGELEKQIEGLSQSLAERQKKEADLRESEEKYRRIVETSGEGIRLTNTKGITIFANRRMAEMLGYALEEVLEKSELDYCAEEFRDLCTQMMERKKQGNTESYEIKLRRKNGVEIWVYVNGAPLYDRKGRYSGNIEMYADLSGQKLTQEDLRRSQQQLEGLFQHMAEGVVLLDPGGKVLRINPAAARVLKLEPDLIEGTYYDSPLWTGKVTLADGTVLARNELLFSRILGHGEGIINQEARLELPDGTTHWLRGSITPLIDQNGQIGGVVLTFTEITAEKTLQERMTRRLLEGQEEERKRIARELHDDTAQSLSIISLELDSLISSQQLCSAEAVGRLQRLKAATDRTMEDIRRYSHELHPALLDQLGLVAALEQLAAETGERAGMEALLHVQGKERKLAEDIELVLFRIAQEALNNIWKHAGATEANVILEYSVHQTRLSIIDNGKGFQVGKESAAATRRGSLGLLSMRERASLIGAELKIESRLKQGTRVIVEVTA